MNDTEKTPTPLPKSKVLLSEDCGASYNSVCGGNVSLYALSLCSLYGG